MVETGLGSLLVGVSAILVGTGTLYVLIRFSTLIAKLEKKLDDEN